MKVCIVTGTRAEYGLLKPLIDVLSIHDAFTLQLLVTGAHLSPEFGLTYKQIENDGIRIDHKVEMLLSSDTAEGIVKSMGLGMIGFADAFKALQPDLIVILGDRYEMLSLAAAASIFKIPIAHLHGGEITEGAYDDAIRHAITKLSHLHFTSTEAHRKRVIQLGENPNRVFNVGAIGLDNIARLNLSTYTQLEEQLNVKFKKHNYLVAFHPETLSDQSSEQQFRKLLNAISAQQDSFFIFTKANADTDGRIINQMIDDYVKNNGTTSAAFHSLGSLRFLSAVKCCDAIIGNSSSGIIEVPFLRVATINLGDRQKGRIAADSVINAPIDETAIKQCFEHIKTDSFKEVLANTTSPYGLGDTANSIFKILKEVDLNLLKTKTFFDFE